MVLLRLAGYSEHLNWRPIDFVSPPDSNCSVCGVLAFRTQFLPCFHRICLFCYQSGIRQRKVCPLDQMAFDKNQVKTVCWFEKDQLAQTVRCTNYARGCEFEGPLSDWLAHFARKCEFHQVTCKRCTKSLVRNEMGRHLESCHTHHLVPKRAARLSKKEMSPSSQHATTMLFDMVCNLRSALAAHESSQSLLKNALGVVYDAFQKPSVDKRMPTIHSTTVYVEDISGCKNIARQATEGPTRLLGPLVVGGYYMRMHVCLSEVTDWKLMFWLEVCTGPRDAFLRWPLDAPCSVLLKRPNQLPQPLQIEYHDGCGRPNRERPSFYFVNTATCSVAELEAQGFLVNDALEVSIELALGDTDSLLRTQANK